MITINSQVGRGVSTSILEELATEYAFRVLQNQLDKSVLLNGVSIEVFTMTALDNIIETRKLCQVNLNSIQVSIKISVAKIVI